MEPKIVPQAIPLDASVEQAVRARLIEHYAPGNPNVEGYVEMIVNPEPYTGRFDYLCSVVGTGIFSADASFFCSGFSVGSEMILARQFGFGKIYGVEVDPFLVEVCQQRLAYLPDMYPIYYTGDQLSYPDNQFDVVASGHVIEHTRDPKLYLAECMRVLRPGGYLSLEFPNRYHKIELHTGLHSFEWLPRFLRDAVLRLISSKISPLKPDVKLRYYSIVSTKLQQISLRGIRRMLKQIGVPCQILDSAEPMPGFIRVVIQKGQG